MYRIYVIILISVGIFIKGYTQDILMSNGFSTVCNGNFYDSGGPGGNYGNSQNLIHTIFPNAGNNLQVEFTSFQLEVCCDWLRIYNGNSTSAPLIGQYTSNPGTITSSAPDGSLTFEFRSDGSVTFSGWAAILSCISLPPCTGIADPGVATASQSQVCPNVSFNINVEYPNNSGGMQYQWQSSPDEIIWTDIPLQINATFIGSQTEASYYRLRTVCLITLDTAYSTSAFVDIASCINMDNGSTMTCDALFYDSGGPTVNYQNNENYVLTIYPELENSLLEVTFSSFQLETCCDVLRIFDGNSTSAPLIGQYNTNPGTITSTALDGSLTFQFISDGSVNFSGWQAIISCIPLSLCSGLTEPGSIQVSKTIVCPDELINMNIQHNNLFAGIEYQWQSSLDEINWTDIIGQNNLSFIGYQSESLYYRVRVVCLNTADTLYSETVNIKLANCISMANGTVETCGALFYDSGGPGSNYDNNQTIVQTIYPEVGNKLQVLFESFQLQTCCDFLRIYNGNSTSAPLIGQYSANPGVITSSASDGSLTFEFISNESSTLAGWEAILTCVTSQDVIMSNGFSTVCNGNFYDSGGPGGNYGNSQNLIHTIFPNAGNNLQVEFTSFQLEVCCDWLRIYNGNSTSAPLIGQYTGNPGTITSSAPDGSLTFEFRSDGSVTFSGWAAILSCISLPPCTGIADPGVATASQSQVCPNVSFNINVEYPNNSGGIQYQWQSSPDEIIWTDIPQQINATFVGSQTEASYYRLRTVCLITFDTAYSTSAFVDIATCINMNNGSIMTCDVLFYDSGGPTVNYQNNENYVLTVYPEGGTQTMQVTFSSFQLETCCDVLRIFDGNSTSAPLIGQYNTNPGTITSTALDGSLTFQFISDGSVNFSGWQAQLNCVPSLPCSGAPDLGNAIATSSSVCPDDIFEISIENLTNRSGIQYQWQSSLDGIIWSDLIGQNDLTYTGTQSESQYYRLEAKCINTNDVSYSGLVFIQSMLCIIITNGSTQACEGKFFDSGGPNGMYSANEDQIFTIYPIPGYSLQINFSEFELENEFDWLRIYNGNSTSADLIGQYTGSTSPGQITSSSSDGSLTFQFSSNSAEQFAGWTGLLSCVCRENMPILYVKSGSEGTGSSWSDALPSLQQALEVACDCPEVNEIWVASGIYLPGQAGDHSATFQLCNDIRLYGGFIGNENWLHERDWINNETILTGDLDQNGSFSMNDAYHVINSSGVEITSFLDGFIITGGNASGIDISDKNGFGGGLINDFGSLEVRNCKFINNAATHKGGGIYNSGNLTLINCTIASNLVTDNDSQSRGGGIYNIGAMTVIGNLILGNEAPSGGGINNSELGEIILTNCSMSGNEATFGGGAISNGNSSSVQLSNCILWGNASEISNMSGSVIVSHSIVEGGFTNAMNENPLFVEQPPVGLGTYGDLNLSPCSPAINSGNNDLYQISGGDLENDKDLNNQNRVFNFFNNGVIDLGAYEYQSNPGQTIAACRNITVYLDGNGEASIEADTLDGGSIGCNMLSFSVDDESVLHFNCDNLGEIEVTLTVTDFTYDNSNDCTALITVKESILPDPWNNDQIGGQTGSAVYSTCENTGTFTVESSGFATGTSDIQQFVHQHICGNGSIIAEVVSIQGGGWAGVQIRENLNAGSKKVVMKTQLSNFIRREVRIQSNGSVQSLQLLAPNRTWFRIDRNGNSFTGYHSTNGVNWTFAFNATVSMDACVKMGLIVESINQLITTSATIRNVQVVQEVNLQSSVFTSDNPETYQNSEKLSIYPNPTAGEIVIDLHQFIGSDIIIQVHNLFGQCIITRNSNGGGSLNLDIGSVPGIYMVQAISHGIPIAVSKVILSR